MSYSFDTSVFYDMWHYYKDNSKLWDIIADRMQRGDISISREVVAEIHLGGGELKNWVREHASAIVETDEDVQAESDRLINQYPGWVDPTSSQNLVDPYVIAVAILHEKVVVTQEKQRKGWKIPNICALEHIQCMDLLTYLVTIGDFSIQ